MAICIMLSDIAMLSGPNGISQALPLNKRWPEIELILASGKGQLTLEPLPAGCVFFPKPYPERDVIATLR